MAFLNIENISYKNQIILITVSILLILLSCKKENRCDCFKGTGSIVKESREAVDFYSVKVCDNINLILTQDTVNKIIVEAGENLLPNIKTETSNNILTITNNNKCNWVRSFKKEVNVYLSVKNLCYLRCRTSGKIISTNTIVTSDSISVDGSNESASIRLAIKTKKSFFRISPGAQDAIISGDVEENFLYEAGNAFIDCRNLTTNITNINHRGTGNFYIYAKTNIGGDFVGDGDVYYYGNPAISIKHPGGKGKIIKAD